MHTVLFRFDLEITLSVHPPCAPGFYIGELNGEVVASAIRIPWGENIFYGSYYYVDPKCRGLGFGTRYYSWNTIIIKHIDLKLFRVRVWTALVQWARWLCAYMWAAMYYILMWMLVSSITHVDGACIWLLYFDIALYICLYDYCVCQFSRIKRYLFIYYNCYTS